MLSGIYLLDEMNKIILTNINVILIKFLWHDIKKAKNIHFSLIFYSLINVMFYIKMCLLAEKFRTSYKTIKKITR